MRRDGAAGAAVVGTLLALLLGAPAAAGDAKTTTTAVDPPLQPAGQPTPPPVDARSQALCGRPSRQQRLAEALDRFEGTELPQPWREAKEPELERWLAAAPCGAPTEAETKVFARRRIALGKLRSLLEGVSASERFAAAVATFRGREPREETWPTSSECRACGELRSAAAGLATVVAQKWLARDRPEELPLGTRLDADARRGALIKVVCKVRPPPDARQRIERDFQYYSWTGDAAQLFEVAAFFAQPPVAEHCGRR